MPVKTVVINSPEHLWYPDCPWCGHSLSYQHESPYSWEVNPVKHWHFCPYCGEGIRSPRTEEIFPPLPREELIRYGFTEEEIRRYYGNSN